MRQCHVAQESARVVTIGCQEDCGQGMSSEVKRCRLAKLKGTAAVPCATFFTIGF